MSANNSEKIQSSCSSGLQLSIPKVVVNEKIDLVFKEAN